jgi:NAD(P)H-hydrate epimerase
MDKSVAEIQVDRIASAQELLKLSESWPVDLTWILKGANPIVAHKNGIVVVEGGVSTLAVGGSGDILAGLCGALFAQTRSGFECALLGTSAHLQSGRRLLKQHLRGFLAHEIADEIPKILF